jgi:catechol 2,3-dioxygenase-like lactoylglutathione lyase family enzyme
MPSLSLKKLNALSSRAKRGICFSLIVCSMSSLLALCLAALLSAPPAAAREPHRPKILGISHVTIAVTDFCAARDFYSQVLNHPVHCGPGEKPSGGAVLVNSTQFIALSTTPYTERSKAIKEIAFFTDDLKGLRKYLTSRNVIVKALNGSNGNYLTLRDPEGHRIAFVAVPPIVEPTIKEIQKSQGANSGQPNLRIIHAGFVVHDRAAEDHFYKDILGFHIYWHGGMVDRSAVAGKEDNETDWVDMQVPDGSDWIEYMLNVPANASPRTLGVMNHIALGVPDIHAAEQQLLKNGMKLTENPQIGRDGKWQLNLYDPDGTRVELMEFTPVQKPCCSEYTGPHPGPKQ